MMKKSKKRIIIALCIAIAIGGIGFGIIRAVVISQREAAAIMEQEREQERKKQLAYTQVNRAFALGTSLIAGNSEMDIEVDGVFRPFPEVDPEINRFGINSILYWIFMMYEIRTGNTLAYETVLEYFSREYEPDGSLRLHNNGKHPEINAFVEWAWEERRWREYRDFIDILGTIVFVYSQANSDSGFVELLAYELSPQMLREIARHVADPNPDATVDDIDLTSLQKVGY